MKIFVAAIIAIMLGTSHAAATAQLPDKIIYDGEMRDMHTNPMEAYFDNYPDKKPDNQYPETNLWRGYVATFEILDEKLIFKDIKTRSIKRSGNNTGIIFWESVNNSVIPDNQPLYVDWFSGILVLPSGKVVKSVPMGYGSIHENYILLEIKNGELVSQRKLDSIKYERFRDRQFQEFKKTGDYKILEENVRKQEPGLDQEFIEEFIKNFDLTHTSIILEAEQPAVESGDSNRELHAACRVNDPDIAASYAGECRNGLAHGKGVAKGRDEYRGEFKNGDKHGQGTYTWGNNSAFAGQVFVGESVDDEFFKGLWTFPQGGAFKEGNFKNGKLNGKGVYRDPDGIILEGEFIDEEPNGLVRVKIPKKPLPEIDKETAGQVKSEGGYWVMTIFFRDGEIVDVGEAGKVPSRDKNMTF